MSWSDDITLKSAIGDFSEMFAYDDMMEYLVPAWSRVGAIVRETRRRSGRTQAQLAETAGVSRGWLIRLEAGHANAEPTTVIPVLRALDLELVVRPIRHSQEELEEERRLEELLGD